LKPTIFAVRYTEFDFYSGSHRIYKHPTKSGTVVIAYHGAKDVPEGTLKSILKQAGLE
jgi:predicted RNA binding protein YcfA (HicA-like mRNA interferase family)